ncbi:MAG: hypothetical protein AVO33_07725 [delta proteobacterium ML8_F1]|nr:MAG: hypothetical protein AVO33_07725 [delta proteobacterium ML8_F1]
MDHIKRYEAWLEDPGIDEAFKEELRNLDSEEIEDAFFRDLAFGTGGLRGVMGPGSNRVNRYVIARATQGFADYLNHHYSLPSAVIAYDTRAGSKDFAFEAARVLVGNGIRTFVFDRVATTPELSYAVRALEAQGGIVITASHNPKAYNGYKVYHHEGYQLLPLEAREVIERIEAIAFKEIKRGETGDIEFLGESFFNQYYEELVQLVKDYTLKELTLVYTPLNGAGARPVPEVLKRARFMKVFPVMTQMVPDPDFTSVPYPNPEDVAVFAQARVLGEEVGADLLIATDPDADRVGVLARHQGEYVAINGNEMGALLAEYLLKGGVLHPRIITTIVSTHMIDAIAQRYGARVDKTLTGFKYIGEMISGFDFSRETFLLGFEESYGYLTHTHARDKDAANAVLMIAMMAEEYRREGRTLIDALETLHETYGYFSESLLNFTFEGSRGLGKMDEIIEAFRGLQGLEFADQYAFGAIDYERDDTGLPREKVIKCLYPDGSWFAVRPSGTEPKLKIYVAVRGDSSESAHKKSLALQGALKGFVEKNQ